MEKRGPAHVPNQVEDVPSLALTFTANRHITPCIHFDHGSGNMSPDGMVDADAQERPVMHINLPCLQIIITINVRDAPLRLRRPQFTVRRLMLMVVMVAVSLAWVDWRERQQARWYLGNLPANLPQDVKQHIYALHKPWGWEIIGRLPVHLLGLLGLGLVLWLAIRASQLLRTSPRYQH